MSFTITSALALLMTLGQIFLEDGRFQKFDPRYDEAKVVELLRKSCRMVLESEDISVLNPDQLVTDNKSAILFQAEQLEKKIDGKCLLEKLKFIKLNGKDIEPPACNREAMREEIAKDQPTVAKEFETSLELFEGFGMQDALALYDYICSPNPVDVAPEGVRLSEVLEIYNKAFEEAEAADVNKLSEPTLSQSSMVFTLDNKLMGEVYTKENRRTWVPLSQIPEVVKQAFISAEDKNFYTHRGVELRGVLRGFIKYIQDGNIVGGSTLTQQVVKNLVFNSDVTLERKMKEMIVATRLEKTLSKDKILEIYLNLINLGRNSWGVQKATENYFPDKFVGDLGLNEASFLAGVTHSPNRYEPEYNMDKIASRQKFVLREMRQNGYITEEQEASIDPWNLKFSSRQVAKSSYFKQAVKEDLIKRLGEEEADKGGLFVFSTQRPTLQAALERGLQDRLYAFEDEKGRLKWNGPLGNLINKKFSDLTVEEQAIFADERNWSEKLVRFRSLYQDVQWPVATVINRDGQGVLMGVLNLDGSTDFKYLRASKSGWAAEAYNTLIVGDVVFVKDQDKKVVLRTIPKVQAAGVVIEAKTGRVLALSGGFSYHDSQLNRAIHSIRQPGSTVKPFTYLAALNQGRQPDQTYPNAPVYFEPIHLPGEKKIRRFRKCNAWSPSNYSSGGASYMTMRRGLETSNNRVTARVLKSVSPGDDELSLEYVRGIFTDFGVYDNPGDCYPVILGSQETNVLRMATAYAAIANGGTLIEPHFLDTEANQGLLKNLPSTHPIYSVDAVSLYQLKNILAGAVERGTGYALRDFTGYVAGKTGTSTSYNDAWFMGFSNDIVVGVWVGYDNGSESAKKNLLGTAGTGGSLAAPIAKEVFEEAFKIYPKTPLINNPPPGVRLYRMDNVVEAIREGYGPRYGGQEDWNSAPQYSNGINNYEVLRPPTYEEDGSAERRRRSQKQRAEEAINNGQGGLF